MYARQNKYIQVLQVQLLALVLPPCSLSVTADVDTIVIAAILVFLSPTPEVHVYC